MAKDHIKRIELDEMEQIQAALALVWRVFLEFEAPEYSREGVAQFQGFIEEDFFINQMAGGNILLWGCYRGDMLIGVAALRNTNHISLLFVDKAFHRQGVASNLLHTLLDYCKAHSAFSVVTVNASPYAVLFYKKRGFEATDSECLTDGIRYTPMKICIQPDIPGLEA